MFGKKTVIGVVAIGIVATAAFANGRGTGETEVEAPETAMVEQGELVLRAEAAGVVQPIRVVEVKSKASGEVLQLFVETGDVVARGAELAQIDPRDVQNSLEQAEADLEVAQV